MPLTLAQIHALLADNTSGDITPEDMRDATEALYDWIPPVEKYLLARLPGETAHADDDFFASYSGYTETNPTGTVSWAATRGGLRANFVSVSNGDLAIAVKAIPAAGVPITIETAVSWFWIMDQNPGCGLLFTDGTAGGSNLAGFGPFENSTSPTIAQPSGTLTSATSGFAEVGLMNIGLGRPLFLRAIWKSSNTFAFSISHDGDNWIDFSQANASRTFTPTHMGFWVTNWASPRQATALFHYLRVYEADLSV